MKNGEFVGEAADKNDLSGANPIAQQIAQRLMGQQSMGSPQQSAMDLSEISEAADSSSGKMLQSSQDGSTAGKC